MMKYLYLLIFIVLLLVYGYIKFLQYRQHQTEKDLMNVEKKLKKIEFETIQTTRIQIQKEKQDEENDIDLHRGSHTIRL